MRIRQSLFTKIFFLASVLLLNFIGSTDADLSDKSLITNNVWTAATLDLSNRSTVSNNETATLFSIIGIIPGGYDIKAVRVKNDGELKLNYWVNFEKVFGDSSFCDKLELKLLKDWKEVYQGGLSNIDYSSSVSPGSFEDVIFIASLRENSEPYVNESCRFNLVYNSKTDNFSGEGGFSDREVLENYISSDNSN